MAIPSTAVASIMPALLVTWTVLALYRESARHDAAAVRHRGADVARNGDAARASGFDQAGVAVDIDGDAEDGVSDRIVARMMPVALLLTFASPRIERVGRLALIGFDRAVVSCDY